MKKILIGALAVLLLTSYAKANPFPPEGHSLNECDIAMFTQSMTDDYLKNQIDELWPWQFSERKRLEKMRAENASPENTKRWDRVVKRFCYNQPTN